MAIAGEPLAGRHGVLLYSAQSLKGTPVTPATAVGLGSFDATSDSGLQAVFGLGSASALFLKPGMSQVPFSIALTGVQEKTFIERWERSSGVAPWLTLAMGYTDDAGTKYDWQIQDCKLDTLDLSCEAGGDLNATVSGTGGLITELSGGSGLAAANLTTTPFKWYEGVVTKGGSAYEILSFRVVLNNNITVQPIIPGAAPSSFKRGWNYQTEGVQNITGEFVCFAKSGIDLQAGTISDFAAVITFTDIVGGMSPTTITITFAGMKFGSEQMQLAPDGQLTFRVPFIAKTIAIT